MQEKNEEFPHRDLIQSIEIHHRHFISPLCLVIHLNVGEISGVEQSPLDTNDDRKC